MRKPPSTGAKSITSTEPKSHRRTSATHAATSKLSARSRVERNACMSFKGGRLTFTQANGELEGSNERDSSDLFPFGRRSLEDDNLFHLN